MESTLKFNHITPQMLAQIPFFQEMAEEDIKLLSRRMPIINFDQGDLIISEGDESKKMYFIIEGSVTVFRKNYKGRLEYIYELSASSYFGEMAIMDGGPRSASVKAKTDLVVAELEWTDVRYLFEDKPEIMCYFFKNIGNIISMRLRRSNSLCSYLSNG